MFLTIENSSYLPLENETQHQAGHPNTRQPKTSAKRDVFAASLSSLAQADFHVITLTNFAHTRQLVPRALIILLPDPKSSVLCQKIRADASLWHLPILLLGQPTTQSHEINAALKAGADDYLPSPYEPTQLQLKLAQIVERRRAQQFLDRARQELRTLSARLESIREEERIRLSREIHDELGQLMTGMKMDVAWLKKHLSDDSEEMRLKLSQRLNMMQGLMDETVNWVRRMAGDLRPAMLDDIGLVAAIEWETGEFQARSGIACRLTVHPQPVTLTAEAATAVFRIFKEMLTNIARHAQAQHIEIHLGQTATTFSLSVRDDGRGFAPEQLKASKSLGLLGMSERAALLGGTLSLHSESSQGTTAQVEFPLVRVT